MKEKTKDNAGNKKLGKKVSEAKIKKVEELAKLMKHKTVMVVSVKNLPAANFQEVKKKLRGKAVIKVAKKSLIDFALEHSDEKILKQLVDYINSDTAILFSDDDAFEISAFLSENEMPAKAKIGQEAKENIEVKAGPTDLLPGPDISALSSLGLNPKVEGGKIHIMKDAVLVKTGEKINAEKASALAKLGINPFKIGLEPVAAYMEGKIYPGIKVNKTGILNQMRDIFARSISFAVSVEYPAKEALQPLLSKANSHEKSLSILIKSESN